MSSELLNLWGKPVPSELAEAVQQRRSAGLPLVDLIATNPQTAGFEFSPELLREAVVAATQDARFYAADPRGQPTAREAVARYHGNGISPEQIILVPGTSMGYLYAFRLLGNPGDEVLCPSPTYPLFDDLATLACLKVRRYHLHQEGGKGRWAIDLEDLAFQITPRTRAIVVVSPHNPTGSVASAKELEGVADLACAHKLTIIFDEVFREFLHTARSVPRPSQFHVPLCITLNGFSKMFSLPGLKAGWMAVEGDDALRAQFLNAAEYVSDTFLPVSEIVQAAIPRLLNESGLRETERFAVLLTGRMKEFVAAWRAAGVEAFVPDGGPYLPIPLPQLPAGADERIAVRLVREEGILLHAGSLYNLPFGHLVTTCIARPPWPIASICRVVSDASFAR